MDFDNTSNKVVILVNLLGGHSEVIKTINTHRAIIYDGSII